MQRQLNSTEFRSMDSFVQILCRFQKRSQKVPPPLYPALKNHPLKGVKGDKLEK